MNSERKSNFYLTLLGISILFFVFSIYRFSDQFTDRKNLDESLILLTILILIFCGGIYFISIKLVKNWNIYSLVIIIILGILFRLLFIFSYPVLEDDYNRYLWDGAVVANKINPYKNSPKEVIQNKADNKLNNLAKASGQIINDINQPYLKTVYPPVAQLFYALSYKISPWNLTAWKFILLFFDIVTLILLLLTLTKLKIPLINILIYWWNPLLIKEIFNSGHMDIVTFPFAIGAFLLYLHNRRYISTFLLSIGVGVKIWPVFLFPIFLKSALTRPKKLLLNILFFTIPIFCFSMIIIYSGLDITSGFVAYGTSWENNSSIFKVVLSLTESYLNLNNIHPGHAQKYSRIIITIILGLWIFYLSFINKSKDIYSKALYILAAAFLISPTQYPWYFTWLIPFLTIKPRWSLLSMTILLPLYYSTYYLEIINKPEIFNNYIVWIEFVPIWLLILAEFYYRNKKNVKSIR